MSETYREQHPLLCDGYSDEELRPSNSYSKRFHSSYKGRARNTVKGAAAIIIKWPDHWCSSLVYWWLGFGMFAITTFIIYNCMAAFAMLPSVHTKATKPRILKDNIDIVHKTFPGVFIHLLYEENEIVDINRYVPHIEELSKKYVEYDYNFILILNDTKQDQVYSKNEENKVALDSLWTEKQFLEQKLPKINVRHTTLSTFMNGSPLKKYWQEIPNQYVNFLIKAISIWEKGGIAIDSLILIPQSPNTDIKQKFLDLLTKYKKPMKIPFSPSHKQEKKVKKVNNIRDIIDALENDRGLSDQVNLTEAENFAQFYVTTKPDSSFKVKTQGTDIDTTDKTQFEVSSQKQSRKQRENVVATPKVVTHTNTDSQSKSGSGLSTSNSSYAKRIRRLRNVSSNKFPQILAFESDESHSKPHMKPLITPAIDLQVNSSEKQKGLTYDSDLDDDEIVKLTIDLKGTIIATRTACHSFIGTVFSNVIRHTEKSITDLIIAELSLFCKGLLSTCKGVDVILN